MLQHIDAVEFLLKAYPQYAPIGELPCMSAKEKVDIGALFALLWMKHFHEYADSIGNAALVSRPHHDRTEYHRVVKQMIAQVHLLRFVPSVMPEIKLCSTVKHHHHPSSHEGRLRFAVDECER